MDNHAADYERYHAGPDMDDTEHTCCGKCSAHSEGDVPAQDMDGSSWQPCEACQDCQACNLEACAKHAAERQR
jgi:MinD superfamily P-loop ATPase